MNSTRQGTWTCWAGSRVCRLGGCAGPGSGERGRTAVASVLAGGLLEPLFGVPEWSPECSLGAAAGAGVSCLQRVAAGACHPHLLLNLKGKVLVAQSYPALCDPMDCSRQAPLSMAFPRQERWSGLPFLSPGDLPHLGNLGLLRCRQTLHHLSHQGSLTEPEANPIDLLASRTSLDDCFLGSKIIGLK